MATQVNRQVNIFIASGEAEKAYDRLIKKEQTLKTELEKATNPKEVARLNQELKKLEEPLDRAAKKAKGTLQPSLREISGTLASLNKELKNVSVGSAEFDKLSLKIRQAKIEMAEAQQRAAGLQKNLNSQSFLTRSATKVNDFSQSNFGVGVGTAALVGGGIAFLKTAYDEALEGERNLSRFKTTLDNLGKSDTFEKFSGQADELADKLGYFGSDDLYVIFDKLLSYGKLTEVEISKLTPIIVDFAAKQQISFEEASDVIIKGLDGNGKALKQYGIDIKDAGTTSERLSLIMNDLGNKVKGSAEAFGNTGDGRVAKLKEQFNDLAGTIGDKLLPVINGLLQAVSFVINGIADVGDKIGDAFNFAFNRVKYFADKTMEEQKRLQKEAEQVALNAAASYANKSIEEFRKVVEESRKALQTAERNYNNAKARTPAQREARGDNLSDMGLRITNARAFNKQLEDELKSREAIVERDRKDNEEKDKAARDKKAAADKQYYDELARLLAELKAKARELDLADADTFTKALARINDFYDKFVTRAKGNANALKQIEALRNRETAVLIDQYVQAVEDAETKRRKRKSDRDKAEETRIQSERLARLAAFQEQVARMAAAAADREMGGRRYRNEVDILVGNGKERMQAKLDQLELERIAEVNAAEKTGADVLDIERKYKFLRQQLEDQGMQERIQQVASFVSQLGSIYQSFTSLQAERENSEIEQDRIMNERKKDNFRRQLDGKILSQKEYDRKVLALDLQQEEREKQARIREFNRNKASQLINATVNLAAQIAANLTPPWMAAIVAALGAVSFGNFMDIEF